MPPEQKNELPLEHFARSPGGLWVKALRTPTGISLLWQPRYQMENGKVQTLDANGDVESEDAPGYVEYGDPYRSAGEITFNNELVEFCGVEAFPQFTVALMKHCAALFAGGYGEKPEDIVAGFNELDFLGAGAEYIFVGDGVEPFVGMAGNHAWVREVENSTKPDEQSLMVDIQVNEDHFHHTIEENDQIVAFLCSTIPVV